MNFVQSGSIVYPDPLLLTPPFHQLFVPSVIYSLRIQFTSPDILLWALLEVLLSILSTGIHVLCAFLSRQMAQVQFTLDSRLSVVSFETDCLQVAKKDVALPLLSDF